LSEVLIYISREVSTMSENDKEERIVETEATVNPTEDQEFKAATHRELIVDILKCACHEDDEGLRRLAKD
jgi:hypothetical protein